MFRVPLCFIPRDPDAVMSCPERILNVTSSLLRQMLWLSVWEVAGIPRTGQTLVKHQCKATGQHGSYGCHIYPIFASWEQYRSYGCHAYNTILVPWGQYRSYGCHIYYPLFVQRNNLGYMGVILVGLNCHILLLNSALSSTSVIPMVKIFLLI